MGQGNRPTFDKNKEKNFFSGQKRDMNHADNNIKSSVDFMSNYAWTKIVKHLNSNENRYRSS